MNKETKTIIKLLANLAASAKQDERILKHGSNRAWANGRRMAYVTSAKLVTQLHKEGLI